MCEPIEVSEGVGERGDLEGGRPNPSLSLTIVVAWGCFREGGVGGRGGSVAVEVVWLTGLF